MSSAREANWLASGSTKAPSIRTCATKSGTSKMPRRRTSVSARPRTESVRGRKCRTTVRCCGLPLASNQRSMDGTVRIGPASSCEPPQVRVTSATAASFVRRRSSMVWAMSPTGICRSSTRNPVPTTRYRTESRNRANPPRVDASSSWPMPPRGARAMPPGRPSWRQGTASEAHLQSIERSCGRALR